ncbi:jerky-like protein [Trichonephila clavipes]|nr:jerky-like protein [Trichonephila clavipes]
MREANDVVLDRALYLWFSQRWSKGDTISDPLFSGWLKNFKLCHGIRELQIKGKSLSGDKNSPQKFKETFLQHAEEEGYSRDVVYYVDDTGEEITDFVQSIPGLQECDEEDVENWMACDAVDCGFQMLNEDEIVTFVKNRILSTMKRMKTRTSSTTMKVTMVRQMLKRFLR